MRSLLTNIVWHQRWGIPAAATGRWTTLFKGGWAPSTDETLVVNQVARLEGRRGAVGLAILTDRNLTYEQGYATIGQVAETLLGTGAE